MRGQMNPVTTDDSFETLAFGVCNSDGVEGLSWVEVEQCQVSKNKYGSKACPTPFSVISSINGISNVLFQNTVSYIR